jgi:L-seryl-tRNA(Ser) seleniumtransferase
MNDTEGLLRSIPNVDRLLRNPIITRSSLPRSVITDAVRRSLAELRTRILAGEAVQVPEDAVISEASLKDAEAGYSIGIRPVVNGTGVILHSNLGRACLSYRASKAVFLAAQNFSSLEYDLEEGKRGSRTAALEAQLTKLTGAEAAIVVNNNAAAVLLILSAIAAGGHVVVSRGELVEIGGSFRVPDIMEQCGCKLREVGTTNKTRINDYENAIDADVRALLKVHTSNFRVVGFTESVPVKDLAGLGHKYELPVIEDIGSGALVNMEKYGITGEPYAVDSLKAGADIVSFSGDKLLGGPQAGIILGKENYLKKMKKHPLYRALRVDKMTVAALEETLRAYHDAERAEHELPVLKMMSAGPEELRSKAERLCILLQDKSVAAEIVPVLSTLGSGSVPGCELPSFAVSVDAGRIGAPELDRRLHRLSKPVVGLVRERYLLDIRTMFEADLEYTADAVAEALL